MAAAAERQFCVLLLIWTLFVGFTAGLWCYQCIDSGEDRDCRDAGRLLNTTEKKEGSREKGELWKRNKYFKNCDNENINYTMCMIEIYSTGGVKKSYHRDCSDGKTFSFTGSAIKYPRLENLIPDNQSTCTYKSASNLQVCLQLCRDDMCNGPVVPEEPEIVCRNITNDFGENVTICAASSLTHFLTHESLHVVFGSFFLPYMIYFLAILVLV